MKTVMKRVAGLVAILALGLTAVHAQDDGALLDALVKKGVLSDQEAEDVRASLVKDFANTSAGKLSLSPSIQQLKLYGDGRVRFENIDQKNQSTATKEQPSTITDRERYRLRVGADYTYTDHFKAGFELESAAGSDSANQTTGSVFGKYPIYIGKIYAQYSPADWVTLWAGKFTNPLYTTDLVWDPDINPEGAAEVLSFDPTDSLNVGFVAGQFIYAANADNTSVIAGGSQVNNNDVWQFNQQIPVTWKITKDVTLKAAPGFAFTTGGSVGSDPDTSAEGLANGGASSGVANNSQAPAINGPRAADYLNTFTLPGEVDFKLFDKSAAVFWNTSYNITSNQRINRVYASPTANTYKPNFTDALAWQAGLKYGQNKKKKDWSILADYRQIGAGSVDPNENDSDWGDNFVNQQGIKAQFQYNFTDFLVGSVAYYNTWQLRGNAYAATGSAGTPFVSANTGANPLSEVSSQRVQADLVWKF